MDVESTVCYKCPLGNAEVCHPKLKPEEIQLDTNNNYRIIKAKDNLFCRHYSCNVGRSMAELMVKYIGNRRSIQAQVVYTSSSTHKQLVIPFGTIDKPARLNLRRIVNRAGTIFSRASLKDPNYYQTGQKAEALIK